MSVRTSGERLIFIACSGQPEDVFVGEMGYMMTNRVHRVWQNPRLSGNGYMEMSILATHLTNMTFEHTFCPPYTRFVQSTGVILNRFDTVHSLKLEPGLFLTQYVKPSTKRKDLRRIYDSLDRSYIPQYRQLHYCSEQDSKQRVKNTFTSIINSYEKDILIISDGPSIAAMCQHVTMLDEIPVEGSLTKLSHSDDGELKCLFYNNTAHLENFEREEFKGHLESYHDVTWVESEPEDYEQ